MRNSHDSQQQYGHELKVRNDPQARRRSQLQAMAHSNSPPSWPQEPLEDCKWEGAPTGPDDLSRRNAKPRRIEGTHQVDHQGGESKLYNLTVAQRRTTGAC